MVRECLEETGAEVTPAGLLSVGHTLIGDQGIVILHYRARLQGGELAARDEVQELGWFSPDALPPLAFASHRAVLREWASSLKIA
jgi:ADP-ribose pyrophosphatase YjhB (NUDIX family)